MICPLASTLQFQTFLQTVGILLYIPSAFRHVDDDGIAMSNKISITLLTCGDTGDQYHKI